MINQNAINEYNAIGSNMKQVGYSCRIKISESGEFDKMERIKRESALT